MQNEDVRGLARLREDVGGLKRKKEEEEEVWTGWMQTEVRDIVDREHSHTQSFFFFFFFF